jgi:hypothetical protein
LVSAAYRRNIDFKTGLDNILNIKYISSVVKFILANEVDMLPGDGGKSEYSYDKIVNPKTSRRQVFWLASYGATRQRKFSVMLYGELEAKQLAIAERERQLKRVCAAKCA